MASPAASQPLVLLGDLSRLRVRAELDEHDVGKIAIGGAVVIRAYAFSTASSREGRHHSADCPARTHQLARVAAISPTSAERGLNRSGGSRPASCRDEGRCVLPATEIARRRGGADRGSIEGERPRRVVPFGKDTVRGEGVSSCKAVAQKIAAWLTIYCLKVEASMRSHGLFGYKNLSFRVIYNPVGGVSRGEAFLCEDLS